MQEQYPQQYSGQTTEKTGTVFRDKDQLDLRASKLASLAAARAEVDAATATQPLEDVVQQRLEYTPLTPQEVVKLIGRKVVFDLRKGYQDSTINLEDDEVATSPYIFKSENGQPDQYMTKSWNATQQSKGSSKEDFDLAA